MRDRDAVRAACDGVDVVLHNVAQVPLARDRELFWSVNVVGTANVLVAARDAGVAKVVHTSSSAVFGIPDSQPGHRGDARPARSRPTGGPSCEAEVLCRDAVAAGLDVTIVRPRTILGHGRLGIMAMLFEFVADGAPVYVLGAGDNRYQFVHADDLADACLPGRRPRGPGGATTSGRPSSARCARPCRRSSTTPAPDRGFGRCRSRPARLRCRFSPRWGWRHSLRTTGCSTASRCGST